MRLEATALPSIETALSLIQTHGLWILVPFAILEGPIVTVIAAYLAHQGYLNIVAVYAVCVAGDLIGDAALYAIGRYGSGMLPQRLLHWLGVTEARKISLTAHFDTEGPRTLLLGKWTHSAGAAVLIAAGMARMDFARFLWVNLLGTLPKTLLFVVTGYFMGAAYAVIDSYIYRGSEALLMVALLGGAGYVLWSRRRI
jgi:membrane protein DedA with SNARE-associated domain